MRPPEIDFDSFPTKLMMEGYLNSLPSWKCQKCEVEIHPTMKVSYKLAVQYFPLCISCGEREAGKQIHGVDIQELKKVAEALIIS